MEKPLPIPMRVMAWSLAAHLLIDPGGFECLPVFSNKRTTLQKFRAEKNFWTANQAKWLVSTGQLGHTPEKAIVPLAFNPEGLLLSAGEYNSQKFCHLRWHYTDLETYYRVTREHTATPAYAKVLDQCNGAPLYAYDPYACYQRTRDEEALALSVEDAAQPEPNSTGVTTDFARLEEKSLDFQCGDVLIRPNLVLWGVFGSAPEPPSTTGSGWGHAAGISRSSKAGANIDESLKEAYLIEAWGPELPREHQIRETKACVPGKFELNLKTFPIPNENYWCRKRKGSRFRLRADLSEDQRWAIAAFWRRQMEEKDGYSIFATKRFPCSPTAKATGCRRARIPDCASDNWANNTHWYCTLLVWQAYYAVAGLDIDSNGGAFVFPNDIIYASAFHNTPTAQDRRVRF
ncbi:MAG: hypothetical protein NZM43_13295 [Saprospiraceae bacterium]|nr:hypothetical protein [Saprospiraceae bacterium]MDW8485290.1 hypothetical protein [Saprospiraceae bacterium]